MPTVTRAWTAADGSLYKTEVEACQREYDIAYGDLALLRPQQTAEVGKVAGTLHKAAVALLAARESVLKAARPSEDGWTNWQGGDIDRPPEGVFPGDLVEVELSDGNKMSAGAASKWRWSATNNGRDIVAYRVIKRASDGWIAWNWPAYNPSEPDSPEVRMQYAPPKLEPETGVALRFRNGEEGSAAVQDIRWTRSEHGTPHYPHDVVAYKVLGLAEPKAAEPCWIEWTPAKGRTTPPLELDASKKVTVRLRGGVVRVDDVDNLYWSHDTDLPDIADIVAYQPQKD